MGESLFSVNSHYGSTRSWGCLEANRWMKILLPWIIETEMFFQWTLDNWNWNVFPVHQKANWRNGNNQKDIEYVVTKMWALDLQHQHYQGTNSKCKFLGLFQTYWIRNSRGGAKQPVLSNLQVLKLANIWESLL